MPGKQTIAKILGYAGLIPFIVFSIGSWSTLPMVSDSQIILIGYAAVILSFMGAIYWGVAMTDANLQDARYLIISVMPALSAWIALSISQRYALILLMIGFVLLIVFDWFSAKPLRLPGWYIAMRNRLTLVVIMCLSATLLSPDNYNLFSL